MSRLKTIADFVQSASSKLKPLLSPQDPGQSFRERELRGSVERGPYAYAMLRAADLARFCKRDRVTVCEFGVATGNGMRNLVSLSKEVTELTGVTFDIVGFDTGEGLPQLVGGHKDHPELWVEGDFAMADPKALIASLEGRGRMIFGNIADTIQQFAEALTPEAPLAFISIDVDIYSGTVEALKCLERTPDRYLPVVGVYLDDCLGYFANDWCGELAAVHEFNAAHEMRKIGIDRSLSGRPKERWHEQMYGAHILDHELRQKPAARTAMSLEEHADFIRSATE